MATEVKVPAMGESITSGILSAWHVNDGDVVSAGQVLYELETDKITSEGVAEVGGKISFKAAAGDEVEIGQIIAEIDESVAAPATTPDSTPTPTPAPETTKKEAAPSNVKPHEAISPAVRRIAQETGVNPASVPGSGKDGRVTKGDMLKAPSVPAPSTKASPDNSDRTTRVKMTPLRRKIAERLVAAQHEAAMLTTFNEVDMSPIMNLRKTHQEAFVGKYGVKLGFMSFFVKAAVKALQEIPAINSEIDGDHIIQNHFYDIGIAVGGPKGLMVPVVRGCDELNFAEIEKAIITYANKIKEGKIAIEDLQGGVFTISNGGIYGSMLSTPILNAPQSAILGMHNIKERAVVVNGEIVIRPMMYLALSYDHRVVDGKEAVTFLNKIREALEDPTLLLFEI